MVAIDQHESAVRPSPLAGVFGLLSRDMLRSLLASPKYLFRRTDAEIQKQRLKAADAISSQAGQPTSAPLVEPARLGVAGIVSRLQPAAEISAHVAQDVETTTHDALASLDRTEYDLAVIRSELAQYMDLKPPRG